MEATVGCKWTAVAAGDTSVDFRFACHLTAPNYITRVAHCPVRRGVLRLFARGFVYGPVESVCCKRDAVEKLLIESQKVSPCSAISLTVVHFLTHMHIFASPGK